MNRPLILFLALGLAGCSTLIPRTPGAPADVAPEVVDSTQLSNLGVLQYDARALSFPRLRDVPLPTVEHIELPNGLKLYITEDHSLPMVSISARIGAGSLWEPAGKIGLAGIAGTVMRTGGTASMSPDELNLALENVGATIETSIGDDSGFAFMNTLTESLDTVLPLFADVLMNPGFDAAQVELAKTRASSSISRRNDNPQGIATRELFKLVFGPDSPYARHPEYWTIDAVTREDLVAFHRQYFHPNNTALAVWGNFDAAEMAERIRLAFEAWPPADSFERPRPPAIDTGRGASVHFIRKDDVTQSTVLIGHPGEIRLDDPDYFAVVVMNEILGGGFSSRLFQTVRTDLGLAYAVWGTYSADYETPGAFYAGTFTKSESTTEAVRAMQDVIGSMRTRPPSEEELFQAKEAFLNSFVFNFDTKQEILNRQMTYAYYGYPEDFVQRIKAGVEAVTAEDVQRVAQRYLHPDEARVLVLGNAESFSEPISVLGDVQEVDITIPLAREGGAVANPAGDDAAGAELLATILEALGGADVFAAVEAIRYQAISEQGPEGTRTTTEADATFVFPDKIRIVQRAPMGEITIVVNGAEGKIITPMGEQAAPPALVTQVRAQVYFELAYLLAQSVQMSIARLPDEDALHVLSLSPSAEVGPFRLYIDPASGLPRRVVGMLAGIDGPTESMVRFGDYREVGGIRLPFLATQFTNGESSGRTEYSSIEINPIVDASLFDLGD